MKNFPLFFCLISFLSCGGPDDPKVKTFSWESIPETVKLTGKKHYFEQLKMPENLLIKDDLLIVGESGKLPSEFPPIHIIDHKTWDYKISKGVIGFGPGEISDSWILDKGSKKESFWVYSVTEKRFSEFNINDTVSLSHNQIKQEDEFYMAIAMAWASDSTVMCRLANDKNQFVEYHINGTRVGGYGLWGDFLVRKDMNDFMMGDLHQGKFKGNQQKKIYVSAGIFRDRLEILNKNSGKIIMVDGPENFIPKFKIIDRNVIVDYDEPYAYRDVYISDDHIYGLYCGRNVKQLREGNEDSTEIFVFDLEGNIQYEYKLDHSIRRLAVDEASKRIFGVTTDEDPGIVVFEMPV